MRVLLLVVLAVTVSGCRVPYGSDLADLTVWPDGMPEAGTSGADLDTWFRAEGYVPGPDVHQSVASLARRPGDPLPYSLASEKLWWQTQSRSIRNFCVTTRTVYYRMTDDGALDQAIQSHRSQC
ncbi:MAG: hypothetical protein AAF557_17415 [Pseudomonadota bacterium]